MLAQLVQKPQIQSPAPQKQPLKNTEARHSGIHLKSSLFHKWKDDLKPGVRGWPWQHGRDDLKREMEKESSDPGPCQTITTPTPSSEKTR